MACSLVQGQINLRDAVRHDCSFVDPKSGKQYQLGPKLATLLVRDAHPSIGVDWLTAQLPIWDTMPY